MQLLDLLDNRLPLLLCMADSSRIASADVRQTLFRRDVDNKLNHSLSKGTKIVDMVSSTA